MTTLLRTGIAGLAAVAIALGGMLPMAVADERPNILWITSEDHGPHMGCYGDALASTPNVDALAAKGLLYTRAWSCAPVCAPARTTLIAGMYATSTGGQHMRSMVPYPAGKQMFPQLLRAAGYYCTNNNKEDYNLTTPGEVWDDSSRQAHWQNRPADKPFFAVFNSGKSHESKIRSRPHTPVHDPAQMRVPAYHPDAPEVRQDWAQYYDIVSEADADAGQRLRELEAAGLSESTVVFYFADHGSGMPRSKRWPYNSGLHVPLVVFIPEKFKSLRPDDYQPGGKSDRLVSFVDFAPTVLSLAGIKPPDWMQGYAFLGAHIAPPQPFVYGFRGRMDERLDMVRSVTDGRYVYVRNYMPHRIYGQHLDYMFQTPTTRVWHQLHVDGKLNAAQDAFWNTKPPEELYDLASDPDEVQNLVDSADHQKTLGVLRRAQQQLAASIRDLGFLPEGEIHARSAGSTPYDMGHDDALYPFARISAMAELAARFDNDAIGQLVAGLQDEDSAVRYWAATGLLIRGESAAEPGREVLVAALKDDSPYVRIVAAEALARFGGAEDAAAALGVLLEHGNWGSHDVFVTMAALNAVDACGEKAAPIAQQVRQLPGQGSVPHNRYQSYVPRLLGATD